MELVFALFVKNVVIVGLSIRASQSVSDLPIYTTVLIRVRVSMMRWLLTACSTATTTTEVEKIIYKPME
jgi:hypothetical protein